MPIAPKPIGATETFPILREVVMVEVNGQEELTFSLLNTMKERVTSMDRLQSTQASRRYLLTIDEIPWLIKINTKEAGIARAH